MPKEADGGAALRTTQFAVIPEWVLYEASATAVKVYAVIDRHSNKDGESFPGHARLATLAGCSVATVKRAISELETMGALTRWERTRKDGGRTSNGYRLVREPDLTRPQVMDDLAPSRMDDLGKKNENHSEREAEEASASSALAAADPPRLVKIDGRDIAFDALATVCNCADRNAVRQVGMALNGTQGTTGIRQLAWDEMTATAKDVYLAAPGGFECYLAKAIPQRALAYQQAMNGAMLTPLALAKWWGRVEAMPGRGGLSPDELEQVVDAETARLAEEQR